MNVFLVDLTHGGVKISSELAKSGKYEKVFAYDIYNTLKKEDEDLLNTYDVNIIKGLDSFKSQIKSNSMKKIENQAKRKEKTFILFYLLFLFLLQNLSYFVRILVLIYFFGGK